MLAEGFQTERKQEKVNLWVSGKKKEYGKQKCG